jgi:hypothetical protein
MISLRAAAASTPSLLGGRNRVLYRWPRKLLGLPKMSPGIYTMWACVEHLSPSFKNEGGGRRFL